MSALTGSFDKIGNPIVTISVRGVFTGGKKEFEAVIDTGFTGFLQMPLFEAFPLGLVLAGTTSVTLADGSASPRLMAIGTVTIGTT
jgi:predicted aspartyl protease